MNPTLYETLAIGLGTYLIRAGSLSLGSRVTWPLWAQRWLSFVTPAVLGALVGPELFLHNRQWIPLLHDPFLFAALPTIAVAWFTRNLLYTVATGVLCFAILSHWL